jgi:hypothetical protein
MFVRANVTLTGSPMLKTVFSINIVSSRLTLDAVNSVMVGGEGIGVGVGIDVGTGVAVGVGIGVINGWVKFSGVVCGS